MNAVLKDKIETLNNDLVFYTGLYKKSRKQKNHMAMVNYSNIMQQIKNKIDFYIIQGA